MLRILLAKDLRRARRNPVPWLVSLVVPFFITGLIGAIFGPHSGSGGLGQIKIALVDEDDTALTQFMRGALEQMTTADPKKKGPPFKLEPQFLHRSEAMRRLTGNELAAAVIVPKGFTDGLLDDQGAIQLELVKNPAQAIPPRVVEETLGLLVTSMNAFRLLAGDMLGDVRALVHSKDDFLTKLATGGGLLVKARDRFQPVKEYLAPPLVWAGEEKRTDTAPQKPGGPGRGVFGFLLAGMAGMFLLYLADNAMRDLYREARFHTLERFKTLREGLLVFIAGKALFAIVAMLIGAAILLGGGALIFQFTWQRPFALVALVAAYAFCGAGIVSLLAALAGSERRADVMNNLFIMGLAMAGGCMFPPEMFPPFMRNSITPLFPTAWFAASVRALQSGDTSGAWLIAGAKLLVLGAASIAAATWLFRRRLEQGGRP